VGISGNNGFRFAEKIAKARMSFLDITEAIPGAEKST
jgi:hypothetical protein